MRIVRTFSLLLVLAMVVAACSSDSSTSEDAASGGDTNGGEVLPFELIQGSDFAFEADPTNPERGIFRVTTTEPAICAIVWGTTPDFGNFNNSLSMNGTGIIEHDVVLPGAVQGTEYYFRVQGSTADGRLFQSDTATFTIPVTEPEESANGPDRPNLATAASVVEASSTFGAGWEAELALDDDLNTEWATSGDGDAGHLTIDLGRVTQIDGVEFVTRSMLNGTAITESYTVTVGDQIFGPFPAASPAASALADVQVEGQVVRFDVETSTGGNVGAVEVRVYEAAP